MPLSPSIFHRARLCPGSVNLSDTLPPTQSISADRGTAMHYALQSALVARDTTILHESGLQDLEEVDLCLKAYEQICRILPDDTDVAVEYKVDLKPWGFEETGRKNEHCIDIAWIDGDVGYIVDFKSGKTPVQRADCNEQNLTYAVPFAKKHKLKKVVGSICQPRIFDVLDTAVYDKAQLEQHDETMSIVSELVNQGGNFNPSDDACEWCRAKGICNARKNLLQEMKQNKEIQELEVVETIEAPERAITVVADKSIVEPIVIMNQMAIEKAEQLLGQAMAVEVFNDKDADEAGTLLQQITKFEGAVERQRKKVKAPVLELGKKVDEVAKQALAPLRVGKDELKAELNRYISEQREKEEAEAQKAVEEARKRAEDADKAEGDPSDKKTPQNSSQAEIQAPVARVQPVKKKIANVKVKTVTEWRVPDIEKVPKMFMISKTNDPLIDAAVKDGQLDDADWIEITRTEKVISK